MQGSIFEQAELMQQEARSVIDRTGIVDIWSSIGATINLVGSLKTGLLVNNRDIDFHIYTDPFSLSDSFAAIARLAANPGIHEIRYKNLLNSPDQCIEWHAYYKDSGSNLWQIDLIHILSGSPFAGYFEKVADRIADVLTPETRNAILAIKYSMSVEDKVPSILVYQAVIEGGVRDIAGFREWNESHSHDEIITWMP